LLGIDICFQVVWKLTFDTQLSQGVDFLPDQFFSLLIGEKQHLHLSVLRSILDDKMISVGRLEKTSRSTKGVAHSSLIKPDSNIPSQNYAS